MTDLDPAIGFAVAALLGAAMWSAALLVSGVLA